MKKFLLIWLQLLGLLLGIVISMLIPGFIFGCVGYYIWNMAGMCICAMLGVLFGVTGFATILLKMKL